MTHLWVLEHRENQVFRVVHFLQLDLFDLVSLQLLAFQARLVFLVVRMVRVGLKAMSVLVSSAQYMTMV